MEDYIKRSDISDRIDYYASHSIDGEHYAYEICRKEIRNIPTADVAEVKHGKWIGVADYGDEGCFGFCSVCATEQRAQSPAALHAFHRYCRWCGAKID